MGSLTALILTTPVAVEVILTEGLGALTGELVSFKKDWMALTDSSVSSKMLPTFPVEPEPEVTTAEPAEVATTRLVGVVVVVLCVTEPEGEITRALLIPRPAMSITMPPLETPPPPPPRPRGVPRNGGPIRIGIGVFLEFN